MPRITMKRIARELGVSITTVSKVLNKRTDIGKETRALVLARVAELGYQPNAVARSLTLRRTRTLGIVIPDLTHSFFVEIVAGLEPVASRHGYGLLLCNSNEDPRREHDELELLRQRQVEGIVLATAPRASANTDVLQRLAAQGIGLVMIDRDDHADVRCDRVLTDDEEVGRLATSHLMAQGRRTIAHIAGPPITHATRRTEGYLKALQTDHTRARAACIVRGGFKEEDGYRAMERLLTRKARPDAVFAANDPAAIGAMKAIWRAGLRIPDDIAVVGAGDIKHSDWLRVPLTTVGWSRQEQGKRAAELIFDSIGSAPHRPRRIIIPPRLVVRESSGG